MMKSFVSRAIPAAAALALIAGLLPIGSPSASAQPAQQANCQTFTQTGKTVCGRFLDYWKTHGGLAQQGYPISGEFKEISEVNGKTYTVQYFERAEFEYHPENQPPNDVLLALLGVMQFKQKYPKGVQELPPPPTASFVQQFPQTGKEIDPPFLGYWQEHGGLMQQGYPITNRFLETSPLDGKQYTVQYFERAVFELHPENITSFSILLSQLGTFRFKQKYPNGEPKGTMTPLAAGVWGTQHANLTVTATDGRVEFDCAHAIVSQPMVVDSTGSLTMAGAYVPEHGGPVRLDEQPETHPAVFTGTTDGKVLTLTITVPDMNLTLGPYSLTLGVQGRVFKCV